MGAGVPPYILRDEPVEINAGRRTIRLRVRNTGDRPVQVGSHYHFFEVNRALSFDRDAAFGMRLDIPAGTAVRFEPGIEREVNLVEIGGARRLLGFAGLVDGSARSREARIAAIQRARQRGFAGLPTCHGRQDAPGEEGSTHGPDQP